LRYGRFGIFIIEIVKASQFPALGCEDTFQVNFAEVASTEKSDFHWDD